MKIMKSMALISGLISIIGLWGCGSDSSSSTSEPILKEISLSLDYGIAPHGRGNLYTKSADSIITHVGMKTKVNAKGYYSDGSVRDITNSAKFKVSQRDKAEFDGNHFIAKDAGEIEVWGVIGEVESQIYSVQISDSNITSISIAPKSSLISVIDGYVVPKDSVSEWLLMAHFDDDTSQLVDDDIEWTFDDDFIGKIEDGKFSALNVGASHLRASFKGSTANLRILVNDNENLLELQTELPTELPLFGSAELVISAIYEKDNEILDNVYNSVDVLAFTQWAIDERSDEFGGDVEFSNGKLVAKKEGKVKIVAKALGAATVHEMTITNPVLKEITIVNEQEVDSVPHGLTIELKALAEFEGYESLVDVTNSVFWEVKGNGIVSLNDGFFKAVSPKGEVDIVAKISTTTSESIKLSATDAIVMSINIVESLDKKTGVESLNMSSHIFQVYAKLSDEREVDVTTNVKWDTSEKATINTWYDKAVASFEGISGESRYTATLTDKSAEFVIKRINPICEDNNPHDDCIVVLGYGRSKFMSGPVPYTMQSMFVNDGNVHSSKVKNDNARHGPLVEFGLMSKAQGDRLCSKMAGYLWENSELKGELPTSAEMSEFRKFHQSTVDKGTKLGTANLGFYSGYRSLSQSNWYFVNDQREAVLDHTDQGKSATVMCQFK
nr:hypothetical protein [Vibrio cidicii]